MKSLKIFILMTVAIAAGFFAACSDSDPEPTVVSGEQVYFPETIPTDYSISDDVSSIAIPVRRIVTDAALSISILADDPSGLFTIPSTVSFAAGQDAAELLITFDRTKLIDGEAYPLAFLLNDETNTTPYGNRTLNITIAPWPWDLLGTGLFRDDWLSSMYKGGNPEIEVKIHEHKSNKGIYMIEQMYGWNFLTEFFQGPQAAIEAQIGTYTPVNITIDCRNPQQVVIPRQFTGFTDNDPDYGQYEIAQVQGAYGTLENGVITFPQEALALVCKAGSLKANNSGLFRIILPGAEAVDYSLTAAYGGMKVSPDNMTASAVIDFSYGADVQGISYVLAVGDVTATAAEVAEQIAAGTAENIQEVADFVAGSKQHSIEAEMEQGIYTVVALPKDKAGKLLANEASAASFYFPGMGGSVPDCDIAVELMLVSEFNPDLTAQYPDYSSLASMVTGTDLTAAKYYLNTTELIKSIEDGSAGITMQEVMDNIATDCTPEQLAMIVEKGYWGAVFFNRTPATSYTMVVWGKNKYGKTAIVKSEPVSTAQVPYTGELVVGKYFMSYAANPTTTFTNQFDLIPTVGSETAFHVKNIGADNEGSVWHAVYDPAALTLTLDGTQVGYEEEGNLFGDFNWYWDAEQTQIYGFFSFANEESKGADPLVITVDPATKQLSKLNNQLQVPVVSVADGSPLGYAGLFPFDTPITPYTPAASSIKTASIQQVRSAGIPFSSVRVPANGVNLRDGRFRSATAIAVGSANGIRTLDVKTATCEPLPRQIGKRTVKMGKMF